ncbi:sigma 54-interacting transcriptional regulator [Aestuariibaculum lutulentum]|uniref:Sigma 54-interacting transcriptional regulator n=1 Tax=Aestuariibaculum lutulentum TaxID=2920935 RepID=A0ABS9RKJ4_9FLAO|nr:sigma 54-interacting transcriptional regulator [Aestuariibaculum lutulentum]MCH4553472.1 sigma 54-interacting transcriptional regulator [Aestuariibaculum lutulentum]
MPDVFNNSVSEFLTGVPFFTEVSRPSLDKLCKASKTETFLKNESILTKGDVGDSMFVILEGHVKVHEGNHIYCFLKAGECFGEYALIDDQRRSASVTTVEKTNVLIIDRKNFVNLIKTDTGFANGILSVLIKRHRELDIIQERLASSKKDIEIAHSKMSGLINGAMDAIIMFNQNFKITLTNPSANKLLENDDVLQRNVLFFFDDDSADLIETIVNNEIDNDTINQFLPQIIKVIGSNNTETLNEGTISKYGVENDYYYTLILRNTEDRIRAENKINQLTNQAQYLEEEIQELTSGYGIIAENQNMKAALNLIHQVAKTNATVLIHGETGTGKELVARAIHKESDRSDKPLIKINCGAIPANLIESELFGHEKGAFTGATASRKGRFLLADRGTIFLDEIGEMPLDLQPKLLRIIQEGEFDPVGSSETIKVDVRIIAATHRNLKTFAKEGKFREDLYYRLNVFPIEVPALRERGEDVVLIAQEMVNQFSKKMGKLPLALSETDKTLLIQYHWPGNVRELQNLIERAVIVSKNKSLNLPSIIPLQTNEETKTTKPTPDKIYTAGELASLEKNNILKALKQTKWKISGENGAAALLKIPPTTLASKIKAFGIERPL